MRSPIGVAMCACVLVFCSTALAGGRETGFLNRVVTRDGNRYAYQVYVPATYRGDTKWPVILFLHGAGERGEDGLLQTDVGIGPSIRNHADRFPCIVVMPQCRPKAIWADAMTDMAVDALDRAIKEFNGDSRRVSVVGLSMGGFGTWYLAAKYPTKFAALVPICGFMRPTFDGKPLSSRGYDLPDPLLTSIGLPDGPEVYKAAAQRIGKTPVWIFHGAADDTVPVTESRAMAEALKEAGGTVKYTEYEGVKHNSWEKALDEPELMPWLLSQRLGVGASNK